MCSVVLAEGVHPIPFRTRQLSPPAPMVLRQPPWESRTPLSTSDGFVVSRVPARLARPLAVQTPGSFHASRHAACIYHYRNGQDSCYDARVRS